tara:strand:+ start:30 stop:362 length:333 start_codon:yes stop_codon:yes gene_type:complete
MIILKTEATAQTFKFIPREYTATSIIITDEDENTSVTYSPVFSTIKYYLQTSITFFPLLREGTFYTLEVLNESSIIYRDIVFCTDQVLSTYSINEGQYTEHETTNEYILL